MPLIIGQTAVQKLPADLVKNAAFVKNVAFDPVHETGQTDSPAEKIHGGRFDSLSISAEGLQALALKADGAQPFTGRGPAGVVLDITDPAAKENRRTTDAAGRYMRGWNDLVTQLTKESESKGFSYGQTVKLFQEQTSLWKKDFQRADPEAWQAWHKKLAEFGKTW